MFDRAVEAMDREQGGDDQRNTSPKIAPGGRGRHVESEVTQQECDAGDRKPGRVVSPMATGPDATWVVVVARMLEPVGRD